jgi:multidrug resistance efflux pump
MKHWLDPLTPDELRARYQRLAPAGARLREELSCMPFWANGIKAARAQAKTQGKSEEAAEAKEWMGLAANEINAHRPETASSNAVAAYWLELLNSEIDSEVNGLCNGSSTAVAEEPVK